MTEATRRRFNEIVAEMRDEVTILSGEKDPDPVIAVVIDPAREHLGLPQTISRWASDLTHIANGGEMIWNGGWQKVH